MHKFKHIQQKSLFYILIGIYFCYPLKLVWAQVVEEKLPNGFTATSEFLQGELTKPAVIILHGFLATRNFRTVANLATSLYDEGYTILAPNLSLGINGRKVSLACDAIHNHSMQDDEAEIDFWVDWLVKRGSNTIVLVGHSFGSLHSLSYYLAYKNSAIKKIIATSLINVDNSVSSETTNTQIAIAKDLIAKNNIRLKEYKISYCKKYVGPAKAFLSYANWSQTKILQVLTQINIPIEIIIGGADQRIDPNWAEQLGGSKHTITVINGANHFFDDAYEFDLLEKILKSLSTL